MNKQLFKTIAIAAVSLSLAGCTGGNQPTNVSVESVEISEKAITLAVGSTKQLSATVKPENATNKAVQWSASVNNIDVSAKGLVTAKSAGTSIVTVTSLDNGKSDTCTVTVKEGEPKDEYELDAPVSCIESYVSYQTTTDPDASHDEKTSFMDMNQGYAVGDANRINVKPQFTVYDKNDDEVDQDLWAYDFEFKFEVKNNDGTFSTASTDDYSIVDARNADIKFSSSAVGKTFKVSVYPGELTATQKDDANYHAEYLFNVVEGYNVYEAKELSYLDTRHGDDHGDWHGGDVAGFTDQWDAFKEANGLDKTYEPSSLILHKNIKVTTEDVPANFFYSKEEATAAGIASIEGSLKDTTHFYVLQSEGKNISLNGNYFHLDFSELPLIKRAEGKSGTTLNSHSALIRPLEGNFFVKNLNVTGNAEKATGEEFNIYAGGLMFVKSGRHAEVTRFDNIIAKSNFLTAFPENGDDGVQTRFEVAKSKFYDNYNSFFYNQGSKIYVADSILRSCGGPIVIQDHSGVYPNQGQKYEELITEGGFNFYKTNGVVPETVFDHCILDNYLLGEEAWFKQFEGVEALVPQIRQVSDILYQASSGKMGFVVDKNHRPIPSSDPQDKLFNVISVNKSGEAAGVTAYPVSGNVTIINSENVSEVFDYARPNDEVREIQQALYEQNVEQITALCIRYQVSSPEELANKAGELAAQTDYAKYMYTHGGIRTMNDMGAPVLQTGEHYGYFNGTGFYDVYTKASTGEDVSIGADYFLEATDHVALYYSGMEIVFSLEGSLA